MKILAVIPTYNEADAIGPLLRRLLQLELPISALVVDDDSPDGTAEVVRKLASEFPDRQIDLLVRQNCPRGLGRAYRDGFSRAIESDCDAVLQMDADGQHPTADIPALVERMHQGADLVLASRYTTGGSTGDWARGRRGISRLAGTVGRRLLGLPFADITGGFRLWRRELLRATVVGEAESIGYVFQVEMLLRARRAGAQIAEVPFTFATRELGESKMSGRIAREAAWRMLKWVIRPPRVAKYHPAAKAENISA